MEMQEAIRTWEELKIKDGFIFAKVMQDKRLLKLNDGAKKVFFNARDYRTAENEDVREFLKYVSGDESDNPFVKEIDEKVAQVKESKEWRLEYMTLLMREAEIREEAEEKGREEGREEGIRGTVSVLREMDVPAQTILLKIQKQFNLNPETSKKYLGADEKCQ